MKKLVVVTGANGGLGRELLKHWAPAESYQFVFLLRSISESVDDLIRSRELSAKSYYVDLLDEAKLQSISAEIQSSFGAPWALINLAGVGNNGLSWKMRAEEFRRVIDGNLMTTFNVVRAFLPGMRAANKGRIVNASSVVASTGVFGASAYIAAKSAVEGLTRALAVENSSKGITSNSLALGYFNAGMIESVPEQIKNDIIAKTPSGRLGTGGDLAAALDFLLSESSGFVTGQSIAVNGGLSFR